VAFKAVERLMLRAYSRTLVLASIMENAAVDLHRTIAAVFGAVAALVAGNAMLGLFFWGEEEINLGFL